MTAALYGDLLAPYYDQMYDPDGQDGRDAAGFVAGLLPANGSVLELGVGTGRIALPLAATGARVTGVDVSLKMLEAQIARDPRRTVALKQGDMTDYTDDRTYDVVLIACNTLFMLPDADRQVAALVTAARRLGPGGKLVVEVYSPLPFVRAPELTQTRRLSATRQMVDTVRCDPHRQLLTETHVLSGDGIGLTVPETSRFAWPAELDLMARLCGFTLSARTGGWLGEEFTNDSARHVSVYSRNAGSGISRTPADESVK